MSGFENSAGIGVYNYYGARDTGGSVGVETTKDSDLLISIAFTGASINAGFMPPVNVPKGALLRRAVLRVDEAFNLTGTNPTIQFGAAGSVATNGIVLSEAELEAIGTKVPASTGAGTWATNSATGTTAAALIAKAIGGTGGPTVAANVGKATLVLTFDSKAKA